MANGVIGQPAADFAGIAAVGPGGSDRP